MADPRDEALGMIAAALHREVCQLPVGGKLDCTAIANSLVRLFPFARWEDHSVDVSQLGEACKTIQVQRAAVLVGPIRFVEMVRQPIEGPACSCSWVDTTRTQHGYTSSALGRTDPACPLHGGPKPPPADKSWLEVEHGDQR